ncbi:MAG: LacI family DNA-binding transcriptional regulator [Bacteroidetes bacterium]|nr:LacI family DNA-binding transcriptional regulator [Bacteroidota bacterium]
MDKVINIRHIADITALSITTVSRVLNGYSKQFRISEATTQRVLEVAKELNYTPNQIAQSLRLKRTNTIGLMVPDIGNPFFANMAKIITAESANRGYSVILTASNDNYKIEKELLSLLISRNVDALIMIPCGKEKKHIEAVSKRGIPILFLDRYLENSTIPFITTDNYEGAYDITRYLISNGHRKIACVQGAPDTVPNNRRVKGFIDAFIANKIRCDYSITGKDFSIENGYIETKLLLSRQKEERPTAIFALSTMTLLGVLKAINESRLTIPDDISVVSFDNQPFLEYLNPSITCVAQPVEEISKLAIEKLIDGLDQKQSVLANLFIKPTIIFRDSVKMQLPSRSGDEISL